MKMNQFNAGFVMDRIDRARQHGCTLPVEIDDCTGMSLPFVRKFARDYPNCKLGPRAAAQLAADDQRQAALPLRFRHVQQRVALVLIALGALALASLVVGQTLAG